MVIFVVLIIFVIFLINILNLFLIVLRVCSIGHNLLIKLDHFFLSYLMFLISDLVG